MDKVLLFGFVVRYPSELACKKIGIITPYKSQLHLLRSKFNSTFGPEAVSDMELNTVDGFQGREVDILLLSTVRASTSDESGRSGTGSIGFVADVRRMNVALTRAKFSLWIFGNARTLQLNHHWTTLIRDAKERNLFTSICRPYSSALTKEQPGLLLDYMGKDTGMSRRGKQPEQSMPMPGKARELKSVAGESMKRTNENVVANRGLGGGSKGSERNCADPKATCGSTGRRENFGAGSSVKLGLEVGKRSSGEFIKHAKEATKGLSSENCENSQPGEGSGAGVALSKRIQTDAGSLRGKDSHLVAREKRRVMPMPTAMPRGSRGHGPNISDKNGMSRGGAEAVGERKKGKVAAGGRGDSVLCSARKRSREDVESLLSSALIPSKKKP
jgi:AAA domain